MNRSRMAILAMAAATLVSAFTLPASQAAGTTGTGAGVRYEGRIKSALSQLELSAAQIAQIKQIFASSKAQLQAATSKKVVARSMMRQILAVLNRPQRKQFFSL